MSENNMPASLPDGFESRIRNQAGNIIFKVFGPQDLRAKPPSKIVQQLARLQDLITEALLAAHKADRADLAVPGAAQENGISWTALLAALERLRSKNRNPDSGWYHGWNAAIQCLINDVNARSARTAALRAESEKGDKDG